MLGQGQQGQRSSTGASEQRGSGSSARTGNADSSDRAQGGRKRMTIAELKLVSRCANCGQRGHWRAECVNAYKPKTQAHLAHGEEASTAFVYSSSGTGSGFILYETSSEALRGKTWLQQHLPGLTMHAQGEHLVFLTLPAGTAIVDSAAGQDLIGYPAYERLCSIWQQHGIQPLKLQKTPRATAGVGGKAKPLFQ
eukprot:1009909-Amphidinium_carterae.1